MKSYLQTCILIFLSIWLFGCKQTNEVSDVDGNIYKTVKIGEQTWMAENLKVTHYQNGDEIQFVSDNLEWSQQQNGAFCFYNNDSINSKKYGNLYNWYAITDARKIVPKGWHIPTLDEVNQLISYLKGDTTAAAKMKVNGAEFWITQNQYSTNSSGFSALPGGYRFGDDGTFHTLGSNGYWWTSTGSFELFSWSNRSYNVFADINRDKQYLTYGFSIRCVKD